MRDNKPPIVKAALVVASVACLSSIALAQQPRGASPTFEVAAVKRASGDPGSRSGFFITSGRFTADNVTVAALIEFAFRDTVDDVRAMPSWARSDSYTINATLQDAAPSTEAIRLMLQRLLAERFRLAYRVEPEQRAILALVRRDPDKALPPRLQPIAQDCSQYRPPLTVNNTTPPATTEAPLCFTRGNGRMIESGGISMDAFARLLTPQVGRKVIDQTRLPGWYRLSLHYSRPVPGEPPVTEYPEIRTALGEQLGLQLSAVSGDVKVLVLDRLEPATPD